MLGIGRPLHHIRKPQHWGREHHHARNPYLWGRDGGHTPDRQVGRKKIPRRSREIEGDDRNFITVEAETLAIKTLASVARSKTFIQDARMCTAHLV